MAKVSRLKSWDMLLARDAIERYVVDYEFAFAPYRSLPLPVQPYLPYKSYQRLRFNTNPLLRAWAGVLHLWHQPMG
jgi:hypothetical protein